MIPKILFALLLLVSTGTQLSAQTVNANAISDNGLSTAGIFFDVTALSGPITVTGLTTASSATAGGMYSLTVYTRSGSGLGGSVATGPGSSSAGWTSLGTVNAIQGAISQGISLPILLPNIAVAAGQTVGIALVFNGAGPRYFGTGSPAYQQFSDANLLLTTGDARSAPFTTTGSFFASRGLTGSISYVNAPVGAVPEGSSTFVLLALACGGLAVLRRRVTRTPLAKR